MLNITGVQLELLNRMKRGGFLVVLVFISLITGALPSEGASGNKRGALSVGDQAPRFILPSLDAGKIAIGRHYDKKIVLLNFWATWCAPCQKELPELQKLVDLFNENRFSLFAVSIDKAGNKVVTPFARENNISLSILLDRYNIVAKRFGLTQSPLPHTFLIRDGVVRKIYKGFGHESIEELKRDIKEQIEKHFQD